VIKSKLRKPNSKQIVTSAINCWMWGKMYTAINQNIERIIASVDRKLDIDTYLDLLRRFGRVDVAQDPKFQSAYKIYWGLTTARLSKAFCAAYFELMEGLKGKPAPYIREVVLHLYQISTHKSGKKSLQFSFASKLIHTIQPHRPIYDSMVVSFYRFKVPNPTKSFDARLRSLLSSYDFLCTEYENVLRDGLLQQSITRFRHEFSVPDEYTDEKIIDTLIWRITNLRKKGAL